MSVRLLLERQTPTRASSPRDTIIYGRAASTTDDDEHWPRHEHPWRCHVLDIIIAC